MQVQVASAAELAPPAENSLVAHKSAGSSTENFQPAPMPDPDIDPPHGAAPPRGPSLTPALFSHKEEFEGDGYAAASDPGPWPRSPPHPRGGVELERSG